MLEGPALHALVAAASVDEIEVTIPDGVAIGTKVLIAVFLFAVALEVRWADVREAGRRPGVFAAGLVTQFLLLPAITLGLIALVDVPPSVALGLLLVVCLPAGNLSNLLTYRARGDLALSVSMTTVSNAAAILVTPLALAGWGTLSPTVAEVLASVDLSPGEVLLEIGLLVLLPFAAGIAVARRRPGLAAGARRVVEPAVVILLTLLVVGGLAANASTALDHIGAVGLAVVALNAVSLAVGWGVAVACRLTSAGRRALTLEMAIRNTALGLVLALTFFPTLGGVAVTMALYGLWDLITGGALASWWRRRTTAATAPPTEPGAPRPPAPSARP